MEHTPELWKAECKRQYIGGMIVDDDLCVMHGHVRICNVRTVTMSNGYPDKSSWANAHLLAAAPTMYEALYKIGYDPIGHPEATHGEVCKDIVEIARAAIAKTEGGA